jgi:hypothetical protein
MKNNLPDQLPNYFKAMARKCSYLKDALTLLVQIFGHANVLHMEVHDMGYEKVKRIPCPHCGSPHTRKAHGAFTLTPTLIQQRFVCAECGGKFLTTWECCGIRAYEPRPIKVLLEAGA